MVSSLREINWRQHGLGLPFFVASLIFFGGAYYYYYSAEGELQTARQRLNQQKQRAEYAAEQMAIYQQYDPDYEALRQHGLVGGNFRLNWLESLQIISERLAIPNLDFTLENAVPAEEIKDHYWNPSVNFTTTLMTLRYSLLHEGDWYRLLRYLHEDAPGTFSVEACELRREDAGSDDYLGLKGSCELKWYSIADAMEAVDEKEQF